MTAAHFGTDGIRGRYGESLTDTTAAELGAALATEYPAGLILVGRDTRPSGDPLAEALIGALQHGGAEAIDVGVITTPGLAALVAGEPLVACGVVVTASHNPVDYNGLKVLGRDGRKVPDAVERSLEASMGASAAALLPRAAAGRSIAARGLNAAQLRDRYRALLAAAAAAEVPGGAATGLRVVADAAHGAGSDYIVAALETTGASVQPFAVAPGTINDGVGATAPEALGRAVIAAGADLGVALDGDGDRCVAVDERGKPLDGDLLIALIALDRHARGLPGADRVVATILTNSAVERALAAVGIALERTPVGDRHVAERLAATSAGFGGEKSGHLLFPERSTTGDGILSALALIGLLVRTGRPLSELAAGIRLDPQRQVGVEIAPGSAAAIMADAALARAMAEAEAALRAIGGRLVVRPSGTEPLLRIMGEAPDAEALREAVERVAATAERLARGG